MTSRRAPITIWVAVALLAAVAVLTSCSAKKNTAASRNYQAFITRYNIYYNGAEHYKETLREMEYKYQDDYSQRLFMHPADARANEKAPQPEGSFDRSIEKAQKAIQLRSMKKRPKKKPGRQSPEYKAWLKRGEYNPFIHNAWMMMGRSQYMNGDFAGAAATFHYVSKLFNWKPQTVLEAKLWQARCYVNLDWLFEAEQILTRVKTDELTNKTLKGLYYHTYADWLVESKEYGKAIPMLIEAEKYASKPQKVRLNFLLGQMYAATGQKGLAYKAFKKSAGGAAASYRTKFNARIKQSEVYEGANIEPEVKSLKRMTRYDRNKEYLDQIYYAIGNLYLSRQDTANAVENYKLAAEKSTRNGIEKAISQATLGRIYFEQGKYDLAQPCYAEAVPQLPEEYPDYALLKRRSDVLDELAVYSQNVALQDSLLRLADMPEAERMKVIEKIIADLKKAEKEAEEEARRAEAIAAAEAAGTGLKDTGAKPSTFTLNTDDSWYFYNTATRNAGKTEFQRKWGSRKLEDNWRRRNKSSFSLSEFDGSTDEDEENPEGDEPLANDSIPEKSEEELAHESDPHYPEYYLKQIPSTEEERQTANDVIQEGLYNMGVILKNQLQDYPAAAIQFAQLLERYPDNIYRLDAYYNLYLMWMQAGRPDEAEKWRQMVLKEFPESRYATALSDPQYLDKLRQLEDKQEALYATTLEAYMDNRNAQVHDAYAEMMRENPLSKLMPKFMFLHALAYVTENKPEEFTATIKEMLERYPTTDMTPMASAWLKGLNAGKQLRTGAGSNTRGMVWDTRLLANDSTGAAGAEGPLEFTLAPNEPQMMVLLYDTDSVSPNLLLYEVARHNFSTIATHDFDLEQQAYGKLGLLAIKGFVNQRELEHYRRLLLGDPSVHLGGVRPVGISEKNFDMMLARGASFEDYFQFLRDHDIDVADAIAMPEEPAKQSAPAEPTDLPAEEISPEGPEFEEMLEEDIIVEPEPTPIPAEEPVPATTPQPTSKPAPQPAPQPTPQPAPEPAPEPQPSPVVVPEGSEGDDPLLDE